MSTDHNRFARILLRCKEVAEEPEMNAVVVAIYKEALQGPATVYLTADDAVNTATTEHEKDETEVRVALVELDAPYRVARSAVMLVHPENVKTLPDTIKALTTDTDQLKAITSLLETINKYAGEPWADPLLKGEFGLKAAAAIKELTEEIATNKALSKAKTERAAAYGPAHIKYIGFKRVVRNALGANSKQYKRIHMRASPVTRSKANGGAAPDKGAPKTPVVDPKAPAPSVDPKAPAPAVDVKSPAPTVDSKALAPSVDPKAPVPSVDSKFAPAVDASIDVPAVVDIVASLPEARASAAPESLKAP